MSRPTSLREVRFEIEGLSRCVRPVGFLRSGYTHHQFGKRRKQLRYAGGLDYHQYQHQHNYAASSPKILCQDSGNPDSDPSRTPSATYSILNLSAASFNHQRPYKLYPAGVYPWTAERPNARLRREKRRLSARCRTLFEGALSSLVCS